MGNPTQEDRAGYTMYAGYDSQVCEYWKQRIGKEEACVMGMLEQSRTTPRNPIVASRNARPAKSKTRQPQTPPSTAASQQSYRSNHSRPGTAQTNRTSSTMRTEDEALLRSTLGRLDKLETRLNEERSARLRAEDELRDFQDMVESGAVSVRTKSARSRR